MTTTVAFRIHEFELGPYTNNLENFTTPFEKVVILLNVVHKNAIKQ